MKILLAEDNIINQKVTLRMLKRLGYDVDLAVNGLEVLAALRHQNYDLVLMDIQMPEMDGITATRRICEEWPLEERPWIVAVTANSALADREECLEAGMDDYLAKPVKMETLVEVLEGYAQRQRLPQPQQQVNETEVIDEQSWEMLLEALGGATSEGILEVLDSYLEDAETSFPQILKAAEQGDLPQLQAIVHKLKSSSALVGANKFSRLCLELEELAKASILPQEELLRHMEAEYHQVREILQHRRSYYR